MHIEKIPGVPEVVREFRFDGRFPWADSGLGNMELVELSEGLGKYFGTGSGLLVVSAPKSEAFELQDGDVIQSIDGRVPKNVRQALRILGTYEAGDSVKLGIMRDKRKRTLEIEIPESEQRGMLFEPAAPAPVRPARAPAAPRAPVIETST
jgi:S1-C subfamily serine protease